MTEGLGKRAAKGSLWLSGSSLFTRILGAGRLLILAAILPQAELGLFGIAVVVMGLIEQLSETGMRQALIQREESVDDYLATAWSAQIMRGLALGLILFVSAQAIEQFFGKPGIASLLRWMALIPMLQGFFNIGFVHLHRELAFEKVVVHTTSMDLFNILSSLVLAWFWPVALSLVIGKLAAVAVGLTLSFVLERRHGTFSFSITKFRELYKFGFWIFVSSLLSFTMVRGGDLVTGKLLAVEALAIYQVAYSLACVPLMQMIQVISTTMYTAFSRLQSDHERLSAAFLKVFTLTCILSVASVTGFAAMGSLFTSMFLKPSYVLVASLLPVLAVWGASRALGSINTVLFQATGRPELATVFQAIMVLLFFTVAIPLTWQYELIGLAWGLVICGFVSQLGRFILLSSILKISLGSIIIRLVVPSVIGLVAYTGSVATLFALDAFSPWVQLLTSTAVLLLIYFMGTLFTERWLDFGVLRFVSNQVPALGRLLTFTSFWSRKSELAHAPERTQQK